MGQIPRRTNITDVSIGYPCTITTEDEHEFETGDFVRLTDLNGAMPNPRGVDQLNNYRFRVVVTGDTTFVIQYPVTHELVDSSNYPPYVTGGSCNLIERDYVYYNDDE